MHLLVWFTQSTPALIDLFILCPYVHILTFFVNCIYNECSRISASLNRALVVLPIGEKSWTNSAAAETLQSDMMLWNSLWLNRTPRQLMYGFKCTECHSQGACTEQYATLLCFQYISFVVFPSFCCFSNILESSALFLTLIPISEFGISQVLL